MTGFPTPSRRRLLQYTALWMAACSGFSGQAVRAQDLASPVGTYQLQGVREMASAIQLRADGTYKFLLIYGSADETDVGTWEKRGQQIVLNSTAPSTDPQFELVHSSQASHPGARVIFLEEGTPMASYITSVHFESDGQAFTADHLTQDSLEAGDVAPPIDSIHLSLHGVFRHYPETVLAPAHPTHNHFTVRARLGNYGAVRFDHAALQLTEHALTLTLPHATQEFTYVRRQKAP
ncbi:UNVERIFIED_ORG: hypothetical protein HNP28_001066 [Comamonas terrigena]